MVEQIAGSVIGLIALAVIGIAIGVTKSKNHKKSGLNTTSSSKPPGSASNPSNQTNSTGPSSFTQDPRLIKSFYGLAYSPEGTQLPDCGGVLADVITDIQLMSQLTTRIRLYGADCNQSALVLEAIKQTKVNMTVYLGNYPIATDNGTSYARQRDLLKSVIQTYGTANIDGMTVGNEFMLDYVTAAGTQDPNDAIASVGATMLKGFIDDSRAMLAGMNLDKNIPVGNADAGAYFNTEILKDVDYAMSNVHPWFANVSAQAAAAWTADFFEVNNVVVANALSNKPEMFIAETGWPTQSSDAGNANNGPSTASEANLQIFLDTFVCQANQNGTGYFFFEYFDEPWKDVEFGGVEGWWGLFHSNRTLKNINIPNCPLS
jgi:exo-beta-1,3-glucanase (GH17 family)